MADLFPIKVKEVTLTAEEYQQTVDRIKRLEKYNEKLEKGFDNLNKAGLLLPANFLECNELRIIFDEATRKTTVIGR